MRIQAIKPVFTVVNSKPVRIDAGKVFTVTVPMVKPTRVMVQLDRVSYAWVPLSSFRVIA